MGIILNWNSTYPGSGIDDTITNFPTVTNLTHDVMASHVNALATAIVATQTVLGVPNDPNISTVSGLVRSLLSRGGSSFYLGTSTPQLVPLPTGQAWVTVGASGANNWSLTSGSSNFILYTLGTETGELQFTGTGPKICAISGTVVFRNPFASPSVTIEFGIFVDGSLVDASRMTCATSETFVSVPIGNIMSSFATSSRAVIKVRNVDLVNPGVDIEVSAATLSII